MRFSDVLKTRAIAGSLAIIAVLSIFQGYFLTIVQLPENWYVPIIFAALAIILEATVDVRKFESHVQNIIQESDLSRRRIYHEHDRLLSDVLDNLRTTTGELRLFRIKSDPPTDYQSPHASNFHEELSEWCERNPATPAKRIMTISNEEVFKWAIQQAQLAEEHSNLYVRVVSRNAEFDMVNTALLGNKDVYFSFTYDTAETARGMYIQDQEVVDLYTEYFDYIWPKGTPVKEYVRNHADEYDVSVPFEDL